MNFVLGDTIAAVATPPGAGGIGIVRMSGPRVATIMQAMVGQLRPRYAHWRNFRDSQGAVIDSGIAIFFPGPTSFTGEDVLELQGHGGPVVLDMLLGAGLAQGARLAEPGEFSFRGFYNDRIDLVQAEAIADLIASESQHAAKAALRSLEGEFSRYLQQLAEQLHEIRIIVEASLDFPEDELDGIEDYAVADKLEQLGQSLAALITQAHDAVLQREGLTIAIVGRPNVGKSSLFNQLCKDADAIVTEIPGTTRDILKETLDVNGTPIRLLDTAGMREGGDRLEREGHNRTQLALQQADRALFVFDASEGWTSDDDAVYGQVDQYDEGFDIDIIANKSDLSGHAYGWQDNKLYLSARDGYGIEVLLEHLQNLFQTRGQAEHRFAARRRHIDALKRCHLAVNAAQRTLAEQGTADWLADELQTAELALGEITGQTSNEALLGEIFSRFCIGK